MKAKIILITPAKAKDFLKKNINNRKLKSKRVSFYVNQMKSGSWKENGEPIIIDTKGHVKDGQHRLEAIIKADYSYQCPIISDVSPDVMDTIDTGSNRSLGDVLSLNGFKQNTFTAAVVKVALLHDRNNIVSEHSNIDLNISNNKGLEWALENKTRLADFVKKIAKVYSRQEINILKKSELAWYAYSINGLLVTPEMEEFLTGICSGNLGKTSCTYYAYKKLLSSNNSKVTMNRIFKFNMIMKLWGIYQDDVPVSRLNVDIDELVKIEDIIK